MFDCLYIFTFKLSGHKNIQVKQGVCHIETFDCMIMVFNQQAALQSQKKSTNANVTVLSKKWSRGVVFSEVFTWVEVADQWDFVLIKRHIKKHFHDSAVTVPHKIFHQFVQMFN